MLPKIIIIVFFTIKIKTKLRAITVATEFNAFVYVKRLAAVSGELREFSLGLVATCKITTPIAKIATPKRNGI